MIIRFSLGASLSSHPLDLHSQLLADAVGGWAEAREALQMQRRKHVAARLLDYASHSPLKMVMYSVWRGVALSPGSGRSRRPASVKGHEMDSNNSSVEGISDGPRMYCNLLSLMDERPATQILYLITLITHVLPL